MNLPSNYESFISEIKTRIETARLKAGLAVNKELISLYWQIGKQILERREKEGWGAKVIEQVSFDLRHEFPNMKGLSPRNLKYMRTFAREFPDLEIGQQAVAQIPWGHITVVLDKISRQ